jgi:hypothetical protein
MPRISRRGPRGGRRRTDELRTSGGLSYRRILAGGRSLVGAPSGIHRPGHVHRPPAQGNIEHVSSKQIDLGASVTVWSDGRASRRGRGPRIIGRFGFENAARGARRRQPFAVARYALGRPSASPDIHCAAHAAPSCGWRVRRECA